MPTPYEICQAHVTLGVRTLCQAEYALDNIKDALEADGNAPGRQTALDIISKNQGRIKNLDGGRSALHSIKGALSTGATATVAPFAFTPPAAPVITTAMLAATDAAALSKYRQLVGNERITFFAANREALKRAYKAEGPVHRNCYPNLSGIARTEAAFHEEFQLGPKK